MKVALITILAAPTLLFAAFVLMAFRAIWVKGKGFPSSHVCGNKALARRINRK